MPTAAEVIEMVHYLEEKTEMGLVRHAAVNRFRPGRTYRPDRYIVRVSFDTFVPFYAQVIAVSREYLQLAWGIYDCWTALPCRTGPNAGSNFPVEVGPYGVYSLECPKKLGILSTSKELQVAWSMHLSRKEIEKLKKRYEENS